MQEETSVSFPSHDVLVCIYFVIITHERTNCGGQFDLLLKFM